jgi:hypothetical protein
MLKSPFLKKNLLIAKNLKKKTTTFRKPTVFPSSVKDVPKLVGPLDRAVLNNWVKAP